VSSNLVLDDANVLAGVQGTDERVSSLARVQGSNDITIGVSDSRTYTEVFRKGHVDARYL
jgi:hypothetical protein